MTQLRNSEISPQSASPSGKAQASSPAHIDLPIPNNGEALSVQIQPGSHLKLPLDLSATTLEARGADLLIKTADGGVLTLTDFIAHSEGGQPPMMVLADGTLLPGQVLLSAVDGEGIDTAAGEGAPAGSGIGTYGDDAGELLQGVDRMDGLSFEPMDGFRTLDSDDLGTGSRETLAEAGSPPPDGADPTTDGGESTTGGSNGSSSQGETGSGGTGVATTEDNDGVTVAGGDTDPPYLQVDPIGLTNDTTPSLSGSAEPGSTITVNANGSAVTTTTGEDGTWHLELPAAAALSDGEHRVQVTAADAAGNNTSRVTTLTVDTTAPSVTINDTPLTNDSTPTLSGTAEPDSTIIIEVGGRTMATNSDADGNWQVTIPDSSPLSDGAFTVVATATDAAGNMATTSGTLAVDTQAPGFTTAEVSPEGDRVSGTTEANADVSLILPDGETLSVTADGDGSFELVLDTPYTGGERLVLTASDDAGNDSSAYPVIAPAAPNAGEVAFTTSEDTAIEINTADLLAQSSDPDSTTLTIESVQLTDPHTGQLVDNGDGTWTYTPAADFSAEAVSLTFTVSDGALSDTSVATIAVTPANDAPTVGDEIATQQAVEDAAFEFTIPVDTFDDVDGDALTLSVDTLPDGLTFDPDTGTISGTPTVPGTYPVTVTADDGNGGSVSETFTIEVANTNDAPTVVDAIATQQAVEDAAFEFTIPSDTFDDVDGDALTLAVDTLPDGLTFDPDTGTISGTPTVPGTYPVTVTADDGNGGNVSETFTIEVANTNDAPEAQDDGDDGLHTAEDTPLTGIDVLVNDSDVDGDDLSVTQATADHGSVTIATDGTLTYTPDADFSGDDTITYTVSDGNGGEDTATVNLTVDPVNDAQDDAVSALPRQTVMIDVLANDTAAEMTLDSVALGDPAQGSVAIVDNQVAFTPADGVENTTVTFSYTFSDGLGNRNGAEVNVTLGDYASAHDLATEGDLTSTIDHSSVSVDSGTHAIEAELYPNSSLNFTISAQIPEVAPKLDLYMVQDMTGSFWYDDLPTVGGEVNDTGNAADLGLLDDIVAGVGDRFADAQFGIGSFNDTPNDGDHQQFQHELDLAAGDGGRRLDDAYDAGLGLGRAHSGWDLPESQAFALHQVALMAENNENGFREDAAKVAVLITDAESHGEAAEIAAMAEALNEAGVRVVFLVAENYWSGASGNADFYQSWIDDYGIDGTVVSLASDSSNIVEALTTGIDNLQDALSIEVSGDEFGLATIGEATIDGDTITWEVALEAPLDGTYASGELEFVVHDSISNQVGETIQLTVHSEYSLDGTGANDYLQGHSGDNVLSGDGGDDLLEGMGGNDNLNGGSGNDILVGGEGDDLLIGGLGDDSLTGGGGSDAYAFSAHGGQGNDVIQDFDVTNDVIRLSDVLDEAPGGSTDLEDLLEAGHQQVAVTVTDDDVTLEISGPQGQTNVTLEGINAGGAFNGDTSLSDLIDSGLVIQPNPS